MINEEEKEASQKEAAEAIKEESAEAELEEVLAGGTTEETAENEEKPADAAEEEAKPSRKQKEEEIAEERTYTIPLGKALIMPPKKRAPRAMRMIRAFITKHMKLTANVEDEEEEKELPTLTISEEVNEKIWGRGIEKPPRKIRVRATKDKDGNVAVYLAEET